MIEVTANTRKAVVTNKEILTTGSAGIEVQFVLSEDWDSLQKLVVFRVGDDGMKVDVALGGSLTCVVPAEVLTEEDEVLFIGIYGANGEGTVIIPTVWAAAGVVKPGTEPDTPAEAEPTPQIWAQILEAANDAEETAGDALSIAESVEARADRGDFDGQDGQDGQDGYSPVVTVTEITGGHQVTIVDANGAHVFNVMDGQDAEAVDAGDVAYDDTETYDSGTVGAELSDLKTEISAKPDIDLGITGATAGTYAKVKTVDGSGKPTSWEYGAGGGGGGTSDYTDLSNKPQINNVTLSGNKSASDLGLGTYSKPSGGIPKTDLASGVQTSLGKADSALQAVPATYRTAAAQDVIDAGKADKTSYVTLSGTAITQTGADNTMYLCGELTELTFTAPATGITAIRFTSGTTPTVVTLTGITMPDDWEGAEASTTYEINVLNGLGVWQSWS